MVHSSHGRVDCLQVALPVMRTVKDYSDEQFEIQNGDDIIVISGG